VTGKAEAMGIFNSSTSAGGGNAINELHSNGLITSDVDTRRPIGRLADRVPSLDDGTIALLPDGRMRVVYHLRRDVTWQDGAPFTAQDLVFSYQFQSHPGVPSNYLDATRQVAAVEAPDPATFVIEFKKAYYLGGTLGFRIFWPQPSHLLGPPFERLLASGSSDELINLPYWTSEYVHLGPFRLEAFEPGEGIVLRAYDGYFLGRPKLDVVRVRYFDSGPALYAHLLASAVDLSPEGAIDIDLGLQLKQQWETSGEGRVPVTPAGTRFLSHQVRPSVQTEAANLDVNVRRALYIAIDRETLAEREFPAWSLLPPGDRFYDATKDGFRRYAYDPERAKSMLRDLGWIPGSDGVLRHQVDGRVFRNQIAATVGARLWEVAVLADYWRRVGLQVEEFTIPSAQVRNLEYRALYASWEASSAGQSDSVLGRLEGPAASSANRWTGNRGGYEDPRAQSLLDHYYTSLREADQFQAMKAISDFVAAELPILITYYASDHIGIRRGLHAYEDLGGGAKVDLPYGTYGRNAHLWDVD
jgi:peptide/nickel transport system substrate-binding protein